MLIHFDLKQYFIFKLKTFKDMINYLLKYIFLFSDVMFCCSLNAQQINYHNKKCENKTISVIVNLTTFSDIFLYSYLYSRH